jgi:uncharacterized protein DUF5916
VILLLALVLALLLPSALPAPALADPPDSAHVYRHADAPVVHAAPLREHIRIDGKLDEPAWAAAEPVTQFTQRDPDEGKPVSERTEVRVLIGDDALYIGARLYDREPAKIRRRLVRRDEDLASDFFAVLIDSYHDHLTAFRFRVNPAGSYDDAAIDARGNADFSWDPVWHVHTTIDSLGWTAEMEIPLSQLRYSPSADAVWGIQLRRWIDRKQELAEFAFTPKKEQADVSRYGHLVGLGALHPKRPLELLPYGLAKAHRQFVAAGDPFHDATAPSGSVGGDLKYGIKDDLTLNATVHPDFGQVEVDPAVVNLTTVETFFPEKRPFFVERAELFAFGQTMSMNYFGTPTVFHARRIGREPQLSLAQSGYSFLDSPDLTTIAGAAKLTGKLANGWSVGALDAVTTEERAHYVDSSGVQRAAPVEPLTNYAVGRFRREFSGGNTTVGGIATGVTRDLHDDALASMLRSRAYTAGVDFRHFWAAHRWSVDGYVLGSRIEGSADAIAQAQLAPTRYFQRPDATHLTYDPTRTSLTGEAELISLNKISGKHWKGNVTYQDLSPGFESNDIGYVSGVDTRGFSTLGMYKEDQPSRVFRNWYVMAFTNDSFNHGGDRTYQGYEAQGSGTLFNYWYADFRTSWYPKAFDDRLTRGGPLAVVPSGGRLSSNIMTDARKPWLFSIYGSWQWNDAGGYIQQYSPSLTLHPAPALLVRFQPNIQRIRDMSQYVAAVSDSNAAATFGSRYVFATLDEHVVSLDTRVDWTFTPKLSFQLYLQPYVVSGLYRHLKELHAPRTYDFDVYGGARGTIARDSTGLYTIDPDGPGPSSSFSLGDPNFNYRSLLGNAVLRWEYRPGSAIYLVWQQSRNDVLPFGDFDFSRDFRGIFDRGPENIVAVKATYWLGI